MSEVSASRAIGACVGLTAFVLALVSGLVSDLPTESIIIRAIAVLLLTQIVGFVCGSLIERTVNDAAQTYRDKNQPVEFEGQEPDVDQMLAEPDTQRQAA